MCGHARSVGVRLFRVAARHVIAARRIYRLANGYALEGSLQQLGRAIRVTIVCIQLPA